LIRRDGNELCIESTASPIRDGKGCITGGVLVFHDVSESCELNRRLSYHTSHDILTGLVNRRELENRLERALKSCSRKEAMNTAEILRMAIGEYKYIWEETGAHYEILFRMRDENGGIISSGLFIEAAERYDITLSIDR